MWTLSAPPHTGVQGPRLAEGAERAAEDRLGMWLGRGVQVVPAVLYLWRQERLAHHLTSS